MAFKERIDVELVDKFHGFLMGGPPPGGITLGKRPRKMTAKQSMAVIYVIQEFLHALPDCFEICYQCQHIYDTESEGHTGPDGEFHCDNCSYLCDCKECHDSNHRED